MSSQACKDVFAGLDWAVHTHAVCLIDAAGKVLDRFEVKHDRDGLSELMRRLARFGTRLRIAIERPSGLIVDALVEAGHQVFPIHPNAVAASRPRYRSHGAKSDASDAYLLAVRAAIGQSLLQIEFVQLPPATFDHVLNEGQTALLGVPM